MSSAFPALFSLAALKDARVAEMWDSSRGGGGWSPNFLRSLNDWEVEELERFLSTLHRKISPLQDAHFEESQRGKLLCEAHVQDVRAVLCHSLPF